MFTDSIKMAQTKFISKYTMDVIHLQANVDDGKCTYSWLANTKKEAY